jgi:acyl carrier protein
MNFERPSQHDPKLTADGDERVSGQASAQQSASFEEIQSWLISRLAELMRVSPEDVDVQEPFANFGLNSIDAVSLSGDLEDYLKRPLPATLLWDFPSIEILSRHLSTEAAGDVAATG